LRCIAGSAVAIRDGARRRFVESRVTEALSPPTAAKAPVRGNRRTAKLLSALGVLAAAALAVNANILVARWYKRWDVTSERLYTLSGSTRELLKSLDQPVTVFVFLSRSDPLTLSVRHMLLSYASESNRISTRFVDPDQNPAEFLA